MQLVFVVLHKVELLDKLLSSLHEAGFGATFCDSKGMEQELIEHNEHHFLGSLHRLFNPARRESKIILTAVADDKVAEVSRLTNEVVGGLENPDTGVLFAVPISYVEGIGH